jgi:hypothetical protein
MKKLIMFVILLSSLGCSLKKMALKQTAGLMYEGMSVYTQEEDIQTARETILPAVKTGEGFLKSDPQNLKLLEITAKGYCGYSFAFLQDEDLVRASNMYKKGLRYSSQLLEQKNILAGGKFNEEKVSPKDVSALFWHAFCLAGHIKLNLDKPQVLSKITKLNDMIDALIKLNPTYYYNGPYTLKGSLFARSPMLGGNYDKSKYYFDMALKGSGAKFKMNKFLYAKTYAAQTLNRRLFEKLLHQILTEPDKMRDEKLLNNIAKKKAVELLEKADEFF